MSKQELSEAERQEALRREIEETRQELGDTVDALSRKADVKAQVHERTDEVKQQVQERADQVKRQARERAEVVQERAKSRSIPNGALAGGIVVGVLALWLIRRR